VRLRWSPEAEDYLLTTGSATARSAPNAAVAG
jgi:hypothetical protein